MNIRTVPTKEQVVQMLRRIEPATLAETKQIRDYFRHPGTRSVDMMEIMTAPYFGDWIRRNKDQIAAWQKTGQMEEPS